VARIAIAVALWRVLLLLSLCGAYCYCCRFVARPDTTNLLRLRSQLL
jgi:hypothetical protein